MTARDEATEMMAQAVERGAENWVQILEAIPSNTLARYAIERGALIEVEILDEYAGSSEVVDRGTYSPVGQATLYRVVEP